MGLFNIKIKSWLEGASEHSYFSTQSTQGTLISTENV